MLLPRLTLPLLVVGTVVVGHPLQDLWSGLRRMTEFLLQKCLLSETDGGDVGGCLRRRTLLALERAAKRDVVEIVDGIALVRTGNGSDSVTRELRTMVLPNGQKSNWNAEVIRKFRQIFRTHVLKVSLSRFNVAHFEGRGRHKQGTMAHLLVFGVVAAGLIVIPMGFQFLAVLGGKALLLAKLALLLTSIQGLKRIATSQYGYGLYSTGQGPCKDGRGYPAGCWVAGLGLDTGRFGMRVDVEDESWLQGQYDRQWHYDTEGHSSNIYQTQQERPDLLHPIESNIHPRQDEFSSGI